MSQGDGIHGQEEMEQGDEPVNSSSSSSSDAESDDEGTTKINVILLNEEETSANQLTLVDDDVPSLVHHENLGEDDDVSASQYEEEVEGEDDLKLPKLSSLNKEKLVKDKKRKKRRKKRWLYACLNNCRYDIVRCTTKRFGFKEVSENEEWLLYWTDYSVALERVMEMKRYQKINHFPGMSEICRKDLLARNMNRMHKIYPKEYNIFPKTWCLPADYGDFQSYTRQKKSKTFILKPESGCQGRGIWITRNPKEIKPNEHMICQQYLSKPFLIDGFKFDLRVYVLITSCDPLRVFVFKDGLTRFATSKYSEPTGSNVENVYMHLTNYAINKHSEDFIRDDQAGSKRRITTVNKYLASKGYDVNKLWKDIDDVIIKTIVSAHSVVRHNYRTCFPNHVKTSACFEILGVDILLDRKLRPLILEVNHSPSFNTDSDLDEEIKGMLVWDTLHLINFGSADRKKCQDEERKRIKERLLGRPNKKETKEQQEKAFVQYVKAMESYENSHMGNFRRIYPDINPEKYEKYFNTSGTLFQETASFKARSELVRMQREEFERKKVKMESLDKGGKKKICLSKLRPESPVLAKRRVDKPTITHTKKLEISKVVLKQQPAQPLVQSLSLSQIKQQQYELLPLPVSELDSSKPMDIVEEEEMERISGLLQRDTLVRGLGIVEQVYRLLKFTPGNMASIKLEKQVLPYNSHAPPLCNYRLSQPGYQSNLMFPLRTMSMSAGNTLVTTQCNYPALRHNRTGVTTLDRLSKNKHQKKPLYVYNEKTGVIEVQYNKKDKGQINTSYCHHHHPDAPCNNCVAHPNKSSYTKKDLSVGDLPRFPPCWTNNMSVISAPAPVVHKIDVGSHFVNQSASHPEQAQSRGQKSQKPSSSSNQHLNRNEYNTFT